MPAVSQTMRRLPVGDEIFLDHVGHFVPDCAAAAGALRRAGFAPTPVSVGTNPDGSPTGTGNVTAMLDRGYVEVLFRTADSALGRELSSAMARYAGVHLGAFAVADAARAHRRLAQTGFAVRPLVEFDRPVQTETGPATASFTVARVEPGVMPEGRIQILTHRTEAVVWQDRWLGHPNGARSLESIVFVVAEVTEAAGRFARFTDRPTVRSRGGQSIALDRGVVEIVSADGFTAAFPEVPIPALPFAGIYVLGVRSISLIEAILAGGEIPMRRMGNNIIAPFPPALGTGGWLFTETTGFSVF